MQDWLLRLSEITSNFVLLFPQTLQFPETLTNATLPLSTSFMQCSHKEEEGTYCWQRSNKQSLEEWGRDCCIPSWTICHRDVLHRDRDIFCKHPQTLNSCSLEESLMLTVSVWHKLTFFSPCTSHYFCCCVTVILLRVLWQIQNLQRFFRVLE